MITVKIDGLEYSYSGISASWLNDQIMGRRRGGVPVRIQVLIKSPDVNIALSTSDCAAGGGGRRPYPCERPILDAWSRIGMDGIDFTAEQLMAFLRQAKSMI